MILFISIVSIVMLLSFIVILRVLLMERTLLKKLAYRDGVTGVLNRNAMDRFWGKCSDKRALAVLFLDLDHFKDINDTLGHQAGDLLLREVGQCLQEVMQHNKQVFRLGGDEFVIIMTNVTLENAESMAARVLDRLSNPFVIQGQKVIISGSIGISFNRASKVKRSELFKEADMAMYQAKRLGKGRYSVFNEDKHSYYKATELITVLKKSANS
ncbi:GGDEF domain-containing protein [Paenibacillus anaericanus]|uniref:GGDEF domain-containing protein n=1 Tax=Paenibacillus anaericanus TaxID=170367 RepID=A0A3S1BQ48_9BACL|nr:GGDEF domain-containing protein [Paenibacillus anaericanus]RUT46993.1 GGDEF domain-containing protein [Paenibacillus anaericanus]